MTSPPYFLPKARKIFGLTVKQGFFFFCREFWNRAIMTPLFIFGKNSSKGGGILLDMLWFFTFSTFLCLRLTEQHDNRQIPFEKIMMLWMLFDMICGKSCVRIINHPEGSTHFVFGFQANWKKVALIRLGNCWCWEWRFGSNKNPLEGRSA